MNKKAAAFIISFFLFMLSVPQTCFAELGLFFTKDKSAEISCPVSKTINLLDISNKIVKKYYGDTKEFFSEGSLAGMGNEKTPQYTYNPDKFAISAYGMTTVNNGRKIVFTDQRYSKLSAFTDKRMRGSPPESTEITKLYLLSIEALQKGSVPAFSIIAYNIL
jgi:hypothetical protein